jgi:hypothetical protein
MVELTQVTDQVAESWKTIQENGLQGVVQTGLGAVLGFAGGWLKSREPNETRLRARLASDIELLASAPDGSSLKERLQRNAERNVRLLHEEETKTPVFGRLTVAGSLLAAAFVLALTPGAGLVGFILGIIASVFVYRAGRVTEPEAQVLRQIDYQLVVNCPACRTEGPLDIERSSSREWPIFACTECGQDSTRPPRPASEGDLIVKRGLTYYWERLTPWRRRDPADSHS